jgi:hypothetical protein
VGIILFSLVIDMVGYISLEGMDIVDAFLNAAMLMGGWDRSVRYIPMAGRSSQDAVQCIAVLYCSLPLRSS